MDALSPTRLQDEYNEAIRGCDVFVSLFSTQAGQYTTEEFDVARESFLANGKPWVCTFFKETAVSTSNADRAALQSLWAFQDKLKALGHFWTNYEGIEHLKRQFLGQLEKLKENDLSETPTPPSSQREQGPPQPFTESDKPHPRNTPTGHATQPEYRKDS